ncbi:virB3 type IV secretion protein [Helicobacter fennelliae]|nr:virB3 type IV secretion protein [Helicobacter fennelliae]
MLVFFYVIEFFDDDIVDIAMNTLQLKTGINVYYP